ncbi:alanine racemase [Rappaport israeli]|uniref:alanine racemase n=1 Tax=Rappaport israeli TaxID=1839807 RepID=UPI00098FD566|nr:alanine racemase [Rappaport israeli]
MRPLVKVLDLKALRENVAVLQAHAGGAQLIAVVKANAYGHGMAEVLPALSEVAQLAVASVDEALALRALGASQAVVLLEGVFSFEALAICARYDFIVMVHHLPQLVWLERWAQGARLGERLRVWVKVDSGMHRLGFAPQEVSQVAERLAGLSAVVCLGVATHFACADEVDLLPTHQQLAVMEGLTLPRGWARCYANSAALLRGVAVDCEWVRAGWRCMGCHLLLGWVRRSWGCRR